MLPDASAATDGPPTTSVVFGARRRPEDATEIHMPEWEGPLGLLLALVEARRLDVLSVPLGDLAEAYLDALATLEGERLGNISAFVGVASQLILLKSRAMLPRPVRADVPPEDEGSDPEAELRARLLLYRAFRDAGAALQARALAGALLARREPAIASAAGRAQGTSGALPRLDVGLLVSALDRLASVVPLPAPPQEIMPRTITLAERARVIRAALAGAGPIVLQELLAGVRDRVVAAVTFLALLELVKRREVTVEQDRPWGPILVRSIPRPAHAGGTGEGTGAGAHEGRDAFDDDLEGE
jgi:segregation and condensation protein A